MKHHSAAFGLVLDWKAMHEPECCRSIFLSLDIGPFMFSLIITPWGCKGGICES